MAEDVIQQNYVLLRSTGLGSKDKVGNTNMSMLHSIQSVKTSLVYHEAYNCQSLFSSAKVLIMPMIKLIKDYDCIIRSGGQHNPGRLTMEADLQQHNKSSLFRCIVVCNPMNHMAEKTQGSFSSRNTVV